MKVYSTETKIVQEVNVHPRKGDNKFGNYSEADQCGIDRDQDFIIGPDEPILVTGASGFVGSSLVRTLLNLGFNNILCFVRPSSKITDLESLVHQSGNKARVAVITGNLQSREDCIAATKHAAVIFHLARARGNKSFADAIMNSVVTTRNLLEATQHHKRLKRFVNVSSFTVYDNTRKLRSRLLDESCPVETQPELREEAYCFAKVKQDEIVQAYADKFGIPYVIVRPGYVYGPGVQAIPSRVGIDTFGVFLHLGGSNPLPITYVDNCAEAIALAGLKTGVNGEIFNVVDDQLPSSREFLRLYKENVRRFKSIYLPHFVSYLLCYVWERYSAWSEGQLPPVFNRRRWHGYWKKTRYSNMKLKTRLNWKPKISTAEGLKRYFEAGRNA
jgi:nucleoside-diphosphate-sugar epimerase